MQIPQISLEQFQQWMKAVISYPGNNDDAWTSPEATAILPTTIAEAIVLPSKTLTPKERMQAYQYAYFARLEEALTSDYEAVKHFLGDEEFEEVSRRYFEQYPSKSYTLNVAGAHFPEFLGTLPYKKRDFLVELARLEYTISTIMDVEESPVLSAESIAAIPTDKWDSVKLIPIAGFALLANEYPVNSYFGAVLGNKPVPKVIRRRKEYIVVFRNEYLTWRMSVEHPAFVILSGLVSGKTLGESLAQMGEQFREEISVIEPKISEWFQSWIENGFFQGVEIVW
ncbi:MAG: putative DNA-binding domain-containing protein [Ignavibacteriae bacterium]|nr:putative DNA-binding domain-containing protein [Ignavibacteriota bacterium]